MNDTSRTWAEIDLSALEHNFNQLREHIDDNCLFLATVKADAYGHGAARTALRLQILGADYFSVATLDEAITLRECGIFKPIIILGYTPAAYAADLIKYNITQSVFSYDYAKELAHYACVAQGIIKIHIKVDSGMGRLGFTAGDPAAAKNAAEICKLPCFDAEGIFTHFSVSDEEDQRDYTLDQFDKFFDFITCLKDEYSVEFDLRHCDNSAGIINYPEAQLDMVRAGIALYGLYPNPQWKEKVDLKPVMSLKTRIIQLKSLPAGSSISYGRTVSLDKATNVAVLPIGYADGFFRTYSNRYSVTVNGKLAPGLGRICMDMSMIDVSDIPSAKLGDVVTIFGGDEFISADNFAKTAGTISYEILCAISPRVPRIYKD